ncbi:MAG: nucleotidyltransferase domain-containing protein [Tannerella sp.]|jgi:predicted nucleotidyltransferase|nr:nucleotidyltransferase domain-containing protein [Tannerella sp.]
MATTDEYIRLLGEFKRRHAAEYGIERMGIFGSVARGEQTEDSDVDIYIESDTISLFRMGGLLNDLEALLGTSVDIVRRHKYLRSTFVQRIMKDIVYV